MGIKFEHEGKVFEVDTPEQAVSLLDLLERRTAAQSLEHPPESAALSHSPSEAEVWDPQLFFRFIARLGKPQKLALQYLVVRGDAADWELRELIGVADNQSLAGVLSGVAKQALAERIPPRAVFTFQNFRSGGKRSSRYSLAECFREVAKLASWPSQNELMFELIPIFQPIINKLE